MGHGLESVVGIELDGDLFTLGSALGGYDNDTVRTAASVDCGGESIFQHINALDFRGGDVIDRLCRESVNDVKRRVVLRDGSASADADLDIGIGVPLGGGDGNTRHLAGKGLAHRCDRLLRQFFRIYG